MLFPALTADTMSHFTDIADFIFLMDKEYRLFLEKYFLFAIQKTL